MQQGASPTCEGCFVRSTFFLSICLLMSGALSAQPAPQATPPTRSAALDAAVTSAIHPFTFKAGEISGPGADFLLRRAGKAQFVMLGEHHFDHDTPIFTGALFKKLDAVHGFQYLVVENDPLAMETIGNRDHRGRIDKIVELAKRYPTHIGFASDQDLQLLADVSGMKAGSMPRIWGIEQAQGPSRYLEELVSLAPNAKVKGEAERLLALARKEDRVNIGAFVHNDPQVLGWLQALQAGFGAKPGSRADYLLSMLTRSVEIYSFNRRASTEPVGLYNNTFREALFKENFLTYYRKAAKGGKLPKALFKQGMYHMYRGKSPVQAFTIANFAHEFAIANNMEGLSIAVLPLASADKASKWMRPILPAEWPQQPVVIDLGPLKPRGRELAPLVDVADRWMLNDFLHGFDAVVILPNSVPATRKLTGFQR
jgi:hypothetical protein